MKMKSTIFNLWQTGGRRALFCTLAFGFCTLPALAQSDDDEEEDEVETAIKQPKRKAVQVNYPTVTLHGIVTEQGTGKPLSGVQLQALGHIRYTAMTEEDGSFSIKVPTFATALYVHAPEYMSQQVGVSVADSAKSIAIGMLKDKFLPMYGTGTNYTARSEAKISNYGVSVDNEISERLGGDMRTIMHSATLDAGASMFIRGLNSITTDAQPLIVVDGIELDMQRDRYSLHAGQFNNILSNISPDDIEKVTVLKNATALYGARGANGVVLIETKRGHSMATRIDANISAGVTFLPSLPTVMNATQYRNYAAELLGTIDGISQKNIDFHFLNSDPKRLWNTTHLYDNDTDWAAEAYHKAITQNYSINVQGGDDVGMYNLSVGYTDAQYSARKNSFNRMNVRFNTDISILYNLKTKFDISIARSNNNVLDNSMPADFNSGQVVSPTVLALIKSPIVAPYARDNFGNPSGLYSNYDDIFAQLDAAYGYNSALANPTAILDYAEGNNKNRAETTFFNVRVEPVFDMGKGFKLTGMFSYTLNRNAQRYFRPYTSVPSFSISGLGRVFAKTESMFAKENNFVGKLQLDWARQFGQHSWAAFLGARYNNFTFDSNDVTGQASGKTSDKDPNPSSNTWEYITVTGANDEWTQLQWYGNVDYNYMNRYFATASLTAEANSRFGKNADGLKLFGTQWALFPSIQLGWVLTNESWFPKSVGINYLRLNAGFDVSGNDGISNYAARTSYNSVYFFYDAIGSQLTNIGNDKIKWETTRKVNVGLESYLLNNRVGVKFDYFLHHTDDLLTMKSFTTPIGGINRYWSNGGKLKNEGFETTVTFKPVVGKDLNVEIGASVGHYKNKVTELPDNNMLWVGGSQSAQGYTNSVYGTDNVATIVGQPVGVFYGYITDGVFSNDAAARAAGNGTYLYMEDDAKVAHNFVAGDVHFKDLNADGKIDEKDRTVIGDPNPDIYGNIFAMVAWKNFTLNIGFNYSLGNDVFNYQRMVLNSGSNFYNQQVSMAGRWRSENQTTDVPRAVYGDPMGNSRFSDRWIEDGSYLRLKTLKLTYRVPVPGTWQWLQGLSVWAEAQNLFTVTKYLGSDPEFSAGYGVLYQGIDSGNLAQSRSVTLGLKINL